MTLVVKEILRRHYNQDIDDIFQFLEYLPTDLEALFRHIVFELIHPEDRPMAHRTFFMSFNARAWDMDLTLWEHAFIQDYVENPDFCIDLPKVPIDNHDLAVRSLEPARKRVEAWCRRLLEIFPAHTDEQGHADEGSLSIYFSHCSIPEFLSMKEMKEQGRRWTDSFNWVDAFSKMYLASCQSFSAFRLLSCKTLSVLEMRAALDMDLEPPFAYCWDKQGIVNGQ